MIRWTTLLLAFAWSTSIGTDFLTSAKPNTRTVTATQDTLRNPPVFVNQSSAPRTIEVSLTAAPARLALQPGKVTDVWAYNGMVPGPTLEAREGDKVIIHFKNNLPEISTIHWHGLHIPADMDGSPFSPVPPGGKKDYVFTIDAGTAGTFWYHPHPDVRTGYQIEKGLYGAILFAQSTTPSRRCPRSC